MGNANDCIRNLELTSDALSRAAVHPNNLNSPWSVALEQMAFEMKKNANELKDLGNLFFIPEGFYYE